jgi:hypothetical protein
MDAIDIIEDENRLIPAMRRAEPAMLEAVIGYLEEDSRQMRSGLTPEQLKRLEVVALRYLHRAASREFRLMCVTMTFIASPEFWSQVEERLNAEDERVRINAKKLHAYSVSLYHGERQRLADARRSFNVWYEAVKNGEFDAVFTDSNLLEHIKRPQFWKKKKVVFHPMPDAPIYFGYSQINPEFERLDLKYCQRTVMIAELHRVLRKSGRSVGIDTAWVHAIYLLVKLGDPDLPVVLYKFYEHGVAYRFETVTKSILNTVIEEALKRHRNG